MRVVISGGGTGGHIYPAISVGQAIREAVPGVDLLSVGSSHGPEGKHFTDAGFEFRAIPSAPLTKSVSLRNVASLMKLVAGVFRARLTLSAFNPDVVIGTGGYTTAAVLLAARTLGLKIVIHEQNAVPGKTNLWLSRFADKICVSVDSSASYFPKEKTVVTGMPIRKDFASLPEQKEARRSLGLNEDSFTIVVVGGSQGAKRINNLMLDAWPQLDDGNTQILHQVGPKNLEEAIEKARVFRELVPETSETSPESKQHYHIEPYIDMVAALAAADLVIRRAGGTIAEITAAGRPCILFPYPYHKDQHQKHNAEYLVEHGAAIMCEDFSTDSQALADIIKDLRLSPEKLSKMAQASRAMGRVDAASRVAQVVISLAG